MIPYCQHQIREEDREAVAKALASARLTQGPMVAGFEAGLRAATGARRVVAVSSGTSALQIALQALGVGPGDEVLVPSLTFLATANAVLLAGARPVFVDVSPRTLALDPVALERRLSDRTRGAIVVHFAGHVADTVALRERLGSDRFLVEDACHALGAVDRGRVVGSESEAACFSFHPAKHITTGEGGAIATRSDVLADRALRLREHGMERSGDRFEGLGLPAAARAEESGGWIYEMQALSGNHRLSDFASALGLSQLARLAENLAARRRLALRYVSLLAGDERVEWLREAPGTQSAWHLFPILLDPARIEGGRAAVYAALHAEGIGVQVHYIPIHLQPYYRARLGTRFGDLPNTESAYLRLLSLPLFPDLSDAAQDRVVDALRRTLDGLAR
ncbi:MAG: aminotransferase class I/II-fold pyridoxal phosphate-dependent enzyme [Myxococcota bacterium]